jgi:dTDP-4-dehydrorhamnose 3,5-epimerase
MRIEIETTPLAGLLVVHHPIVADDRGFFTEVFRRDELERCGLPSSFAQENHSSSVRGVVRGLHFQWDPPMGKMMRVTRGEAFLVAVDLRKDSPTLGCWWGREVSERAGLQIWAPAGFARGFAVLSELADVQYLCTALYNPAGEGGIRWDDPEIGIAWPISDPVLSTRDAGAQSLQEWLATPSSDAFCLGDRSVFRC